VSEIVIFVPDEGETVRRRLLRDPEIDLVDAAEHEKFSFHLGGFHTRLAYRRHPRRPDYLIPYREFDEVILLEKFNEAIRVMTTLGACDVKCTSFRSFDRTRAGRFGWRQNGVDVEATTESEKQVSSGYDYEQHGAGSAPRDPSPLRWPDEPGITSAVDSVLNNRAHSVRISVNREQTRSRNLEAKLKRLGIALGGTTGKEQADRLLFEATFPTLDAPHEPR
jgi:hypothetical protein